MDGEHRAGFRRKANAGYAFIYLIECEGFVKIGVAVRPLNRLAELQIGNPFPLSIAELVEVAEGIAYRIERRAHAEIAHARHKGEWFKVSVPEASKAVARACDVIRANGDLLPDTRQRKKVRNDPDYRAHRLGAIGEYWVSPHPRSKVLCRTWFDVEARQTRRASLHTRDSDIG